MPPLFSLRAIRKYYDGEPALDISALDIREGVTYSLVGSNGSGKSTLLHILAFLSSPDSGELSYRGKKIPWSRNNLVGLRKEVTLLHQSPLLFEGSVFSNVAFGLKVRGIVGEPQRRRVSESLEMVGLEGSEEREARRLSGGEAQRVAMARVLALNPRVLLLDEPLANVDQEHAEVLHEVIASLPGRGTTVLVSTHDRAQPLGLNGEVIHLVEGRLKGCPNRNNDPESVAEGSANDAWF